MVAAVQLATETIGGGDGARHGRPPFYQTLFSHGFRPFFLGAGIYAALAVAAWLVWLAIHAMGAVVTEITIAEPPHLWHAHEMVFGFGAAALGGFLLTAVPNWTGTERLHGSGLAVVFAAWLVGRAVMWSTAALPATLTAVVDLTFLPLLGFLIWRKFGSHLKPRNAVFLVLVAVMVAGNALYHADRLEAYPGGMALGVSMGLAALVLLITIIGGRTIPGFTKNAMVRMGVEDRLPVQNGPLDAACILLVAAVFIAYLVDAPNPLTAGLAAAAAAANAVRFALWRTLAILHQPIVWVLHAGYAWMVLGLAMMAAALGFGLGSDVAALHAFGTGAVGTMILAIMSRASLGHSGRPLIAPRPVVAAYVLVSIAALLRTFAPQFIPDLYMELMLASALVWIAAFSLFAITFAPILLTPRAPARKRPAHDGKTGLTPHA